MDYVWNIGQNKLVIPNGMEERVEGLILNIKEANHGDTKFLYVEYTDPRDCSVYRAWFNDQTDRMATAVEMKLA